VTAYAERLTTRSQRREHAIDVTDRVRDVVRKSRVRAGICTIFAQHTTAGVFINENADPDVLTDLFAAFRRTVPDDAGYRHAEGNSPAHLRSVLSGAATTIPVIEGDLALGTWQGIYFVDFDGPRERHFVVSLLGE
jgi:secondary thiamine-phosphate synthase enzyme